MQSNHISPRYHLFITALLCLLTLGSARVWAQATLENPKPRSSQSGIGVISGWACDAQTIEVSFDGGPRQAVGYGTSRGDTQGDCGDTDNGFGLLFNWNLLGEGVHTVTAYADGVEFGAATVTVTTLGAEYRTGLSRTATLADFPAAGTDVELQWQESQQNFVITSGSSQSGGTGGAPPNVLENPKPGSFQSGIGVISGWACDAQTIEVSFDGGPRQAVGYGTSRGDTQGDCGDTDNGFGLLFNWNLLGEGVHTVTAYADGVEFGAATVTVTTLGAEYRTGLSRTATLADFPAAGTDVVVEWQESQQNFVIVYTGPTQRLARVYPALTLPAGVRIPNIEITSLYSSAAEVPASPNPSLLLANDRDGTVLLALADGEGGLLGEAPGEVEVSVDSTAVTLVGVATGIAIWEMTPSVVDSIIMHSRYPAIRTAITQQLAADKNFLDNLYDYPEIVRLILEVGEQIRHINSPALMAAANESLFDSGWGGDPGTPPPDDDSGDSDDSDDSDDEDDEDARDETFRQNLHRLDLGLDVFGLVIDTRLAKKALSLLTAGDAIGKAARKTYDQEATKQASEIGVDRSALNFLATPGEDIPIDNNDPFGAAKHWEKTQAVMVAKTRALDSGVNAAVREGGSQALKVVIGAGATVIAGLVARLPGVVVVGAITAWSTYHKAAAIQESRERWRLPDEKSPQ